LQNVRESGKISMRKEPKTSLENTEGKGERTLAIQGKGTDGNFH
jgi:hypothetical protein